MKLELSLMELNDLYVTTTRNANKCADELKEYGKNVSSITYFKNELRKAEALRDKIQTALYNEAEQYDRERDILKNAIDEEVEPETIVGNDGFEFDNSSTIPPTKRILTLDERMHLWFESSNPNRDVCDYVYEMNDIDKAKYLDECGISRTTKL